MPPRTSQFKAPRIRTSECIDVRAIPNYDDFLRLLLMLPGRGLL
jgi:hypothetical protein